MMIKILIHCEVLDDIKLCTRKKWYPTLGEEMPRVCRLLLQDGKLPGERPVHYIKELTLQNKTFHAGINLSGENVCKRKGARIIYIKESVDLLKIIYIGGHKDNRYDDSQTQVKLVEQRHTIDNYMEYTEGFSFKNV